MHGADISITIRDYGSSCSNVLMSAQPKVVLSTKRSVGRTSETEKFAVYIDCGPIVMVD